MKTYLLFALSIVLFFGCSKNDGQISDDEEQSELTESLYTVLTTKNSVASTQLLEATVESMFLSTEKNNFGSITAPDFVYRDKQMQTSISFSNCLGNIVQYDFLNNTKIDFTIFSENENCNITIKAIVNSGKHIFVAYEEYDDAQSKTCYKLRKIVTVDPNIFNDIELNTKIVDMIFVKNDLYVLQENDEGKSTLLAIDQDTEETVLNMNLDFGALDILKRPDENILVVYDNMHLIIDSATYTNISETRYGQNVSPGFSDSHIKNFDVDGKLYYAVPSESDGNISDIPSVFDFDKNLTIMYYYENFLSEEKRNQVYKIGKTTMMSYDNDNGLVLIGYSRHDDIDKGGIIRIKPVPNPEFIDQIDTDGVPNSIYIN